MCPSYRRRLLPVICDDRRSIVEVAEIEAAAALLLDVERVGELSGGGALGLANRIQSLDVRRQLVALYHHLVSDVGDDTRSWSVIGWRYCFVGIENLGRGPAVEDAGKFPGEIGRVRDAGTHAEAPRAASKRAASPQMSTRRSRNLLATSRRAIQFSPGKELVLEVRADTENRADHPVAIEVVQTGSPG